jgi:heterodisulfide reductase subunit A
MTESLKTINNGEEAKVGVYVCHCGGNISNTVDVEKVISAALDMPGVVVAQHNMFMCSDPGQDMIIEDIKNGKINRLVVAACAPSLHEITFRNALLRAGMNPYLYVHANIREQVSFVHEGDEATEKAISIVAASVAKVREIPPLETTNVKVNDHATVIGGGIAGLKSALDLARRGLKVALIEKSPFLGGRVSKLDKVFPTGEKASEIISYLTGAVLDHPNIDLHTCTELTAQEGYIGNFILTVEKRPPSLEEDLANVERVLENGGYGPNFIPFAGVCPVAPPTDTDKIEITTGAVVIATGFTPYIPRHGEYGFVEHPEVITLADLIKIMSENKGDGKYLNINGRDIKRMAMVHCVGSRQVQGIHEPDENGKIQENCSRICCTGLLHTAIDIKERHPETVIYNLYRDIRTYGRGHEEIYRDAQEKDVRFIRFKVENPPRVERNDHDDYPLSVLVKDSMLEDEELEVPVDLIILAAGIHPGQIDSIIDILKIHCGADGFLLEVHPKLRPVEVFTAGIYLSGTCQAPMDINEATAAASAAASKVSIILARGEVELEPFVATVDTSKCAFCLTCVRTCPFSVPVINEEGAYINPAACYGCGACASVCPGKAISLAHFDDVEIRQQAKGAIDHESTRIKQAAGGSA